MKKIALSILITVVFQYYCSAQNAEQLSVGNTISKTIEINNSDVYTITLESGQFALINLIQKGIDVKIETYGPDGKLLDEFDSQNGSAGFEIILIDAIQKGNYKLKVITLGENKKEKIGDYSIELVVISDDISSHLDETFKSIGNRNYLPGFFVSIVNVKEMLYSNGQGYANIKEQMPYTINTIQQIESISKTLISLSIMILVEQGKLDLDTDVRQYLPFKISHPKFPNTPITLRQLATHTASINDGNKFEEAYWIENKDVYLKNRDKYMHKSIRKQIDAIADNKESSITTEDFLKDFFIPRGKYYSKKNFLKSEPGKSWLYSNVGATLAAYIVEHISGQPYKEFVVEHIINPLELSNTTWGYNPEMTDMNALKYDGGKTEYPRVKGVMYAEGGIYSSTYDLSKYLMEWIKGYEGSSGILKSSSFQEIMNVNFEETKGQFKGIKNGLFWWIFKGNRMGHNGGNFGSNANMFFYPEIGVGYTSLENMMLNESNGASIQSAHIKKVLERYVKLFRIIK